MSLSFSLSQEATTRKQSFSTLFIFFFFFFPFSSSFSSALPPPIQPRSAEDTYRHGSLSDYSDYSSDSDDEDYYAHHRPSPPTTTTTTTGAPANATSASSSSGTQLPGANAKSYAAYVQHEGNQARGGLLNSSNNDDDDDDGNDGEYDPFADPDDDADAYQVLTPGISDKRMEWKEV